MEDVLFDSRHIKFLYCAWELLFGLQFHDSGHKDIIIFSSSDVHIMNGLVIA